MDCFQSLQLTAFKEGIACLQEHQEKCVMLKGDSVVKKQVMKIARQFLHSQATNIKLAPRITCISNRRVSALVFITAISTVVKPVTAQRVVNLLSVVTVQKGQVAR